MQKKINNVLISTHSSYEISAYNLQKNDGIQEVKKRMYKVILSTQIWAEQKI